jgi:hypothetical protein
MRQKVREMVRVIICKVKHHFAIAVGMLRSEIVYDFNCPVLAFCMIEYLLLMCGDGMTGLTSGQKPCKAASLIASSVLAVLIMRGLLFIYFIGNCNINLI